MPEGSSVRVVARGTATDRPVPRRFPVGTLIPSSDREHAVGLFWDLIQQNQLSEHNQRANGLEARVDYLETELRQTREVLIEVISRLERHLGADLDGDGRVG